MQNSNWRELILTWGTFLAFCLLFVVFALGIPGFASWGNAENIFKQTAVLLLMSFGLLLPMIAGEIDISFGGSIGMAGALFASLVVTGHPAWGAAVALVVCAIFGFVNGVFIAVFRMPSFLVTLATMFVGMGAERLYTHGFNIWVKDLKLLAIFNGHIIGVPNSVILIVASFALLWLWVTRTRSGIYVRAVGENIDAARETGINVVAIKILAFTLAGLFYGLGSILNTLRVSGSLAYSGQNLLLPTMAVCFIGATMFQSPKKNVPGNLVGAFFLTLITNGLTLLGVKYYFVPFSHGLLLLTAVIVANLGKSGLKIEQVKF
ncbi:MAG: ABC transporter permease [Desulfobacterales bacterium]|nr:MAG: ABC transporter permease [Desulfobacterales bacterium]